MALLPRRGQVGTIGTFSAMFEAIFGVRRPGLLPSRIKISCDACIGASSASAGCCLYSRGKIRCETVCGHGCTE